MVFRKYYSLRTILTTAAIWAASVNAFAENEQQSNCRDKLSKKGAMIYDGVKQKRTAESNLEELWKEVARDLITANLMGREDATAPAEQALSCLKANGH
jgi:hypothetical protein